MGKKVWKTCTITYSPFPINQLESKTTMYGQTTNSASSRVFQYEVIGLRQNEESDKNSYQIRRSGSILINVPYNRLNEELQRINRLGGKVVSLKPLTPA
jgi:phycocyanin-associated rod protein